jgi:hypothetical protein
MVIFARTYPCYARGETMPKGESEHLSPDVFKALLAIANRVYADDLSMLQPCAHFIVGLRDAVDNGEFLDDSEPYRRLFAGIREQWPEVWEDRGQEVYERFISGEE